MSISWGKKERFRFASGGSLHSWKPPAIAAIYAITYNQDPSKPKTHSILFVGQSENLAAAAPEMNSEVLQAWRVSQNDTNELKVFVHEMPGSTTGERFRVVEQLVSEYEPKCNR